MSKQDLVREAELVELRHARAQGVEQLDRGEGRPIDESTIVRIEVCGRVERVALDPAGARHGRLTCAPHAPSHARMSKLIQLRNVPDELRRVLKARAALEGMSLSDYLLDEIRRIAAHPSVRELQERLAGRRPVQPSVAPAEAVRAERDTR